MKNFITIALVFFASNLFCSENTISSDTSIINQWLDKAYKYNENNKDSFLYYLRKVENKSKHIRCFSSLTRAYIHYSNHYKQVNNYQMALVYAHAAKKIALLLKDHKKLAATYYTLGEIYLFNLGGYDSAIVYLTKANRIYENLKDSLGIVSTHFSIVNAYYISKDCERAYEVGLKLLKKPKVKSNNVLLSNLYLTLGTILSELGKKQEALIYYFKSANIYSSINQDIKLSRVYNNIANAYKEMNKCDSSEYYMMKSLEIKRLTNNPKSLCITLGNYSDLLIIKKNYTQAKIYAEEMYRLAKQHQLKDQLMYANFYLSKIEENNKNYKKALEHIQVYHQIKDSLSKIENDKKINSIIAQLELAVKDVSINMLKSERESKEAILKNQEIKIKNNRTLLLLVISIIFSLIIIMVFGYYLIKNRNTRKRAILEKELWAYKIEAMTQQINPHFIFNILNSIQYNIKNNDYEQTNQYITRFSRLLRLVFEHTQQHTITLLAEIESLKLYIELEQMRLKNKFIFKLNKINSFDPLKFKMPSLLLQPFAENAIWHGFFENEVFTKQCMIVVNLFEEDNILFCELLDNGVGYQERKSIEQNKNVKSSEVARKRIEIFNKIYNTNIELTIEHYKKEPDFPSGTRVLLKIPACVKT